ncbi:MAG: tol-pal system protein YbgF [Deltaproteobacteria bacterium]|nr:tol-pal system protein YbgF [Deltaproteobacteria bacterium]
MVSLEQQEQQGHPRQWAEPRPPGGTSLPLRLRIHAWVFLPLMGASVVALGASCATARRAGPSVSAVDQDGIVLDLRAKNAGYVRRIEELENRIFILEDQLDSRKLAAEQRAPATLPARVLRGTPSGHGSAVSVRPAAAAAPVTATTIDDPRGSTVQTSIVAEHAVDYAGDAVQGATPAPAFNEGGAHPGRGDARPMLRLAPTSAGRKASARAAGSDSRAPEPLADSNPAGILAAPPDPIRSYRHALETLRAGRPQVALSDFRRFLDANPLHDYADNAQYWIGECLYDQRQLRAAERAFRTVVERYPRGNKVPDAMLKLGFTLQSLGDETGGRAVLESLARAFPKHEAARLASERLAHPEPVPIRAGQQPSTFGTIAPLRPGFSGAPATAPFGSRGEGGRR